MFIHGRRFLGFLCLLAAISTLQAASPFAGYYKGVIRMRIQAAGQTIETNAYNLTLSVDNSGSLVTETIGIGDVQQTVRFYPYVTGLVNDNGTIVLNDGFPFEDPLAPLPSPDTRVNGSVMKITSQNFTTGPATQRMSMLATNVGPIPSNSVPRILYTFPASTNIHENLPLSFLVNFVEWSGQTTVQWRKNGQPIPGATNAFGFSSGHHIPGVTFADAGSYSAVLSNPFGSVTSAVIQVTVSAAPPVPPGGVDPVFNIGTGPLWTTGNLTIQGTFYSMVPLPDGKLLVGGYWDRFNGQPSRGFARLTPSGAIDDEFSPALTNTFFGTNLSVSGILRQPDGKLVVSWHGGIDRLNADGSIDPTFVHPAGITGARLAIQSTGKILAWGVPPINGGESLTRLNPDGSVDTAFARGQRSYGGAIYHVAVQSDDKILVVGELRYLENNVTKRVSTNGITRLNADGSTDTTFNSPVNYSTDTPAIRGIGLQPGGKIVLVGSFTKLAGNTNLFGIARLNADGALDSTFKPGRGVRNVIGAGSFLFPIDGSINTVKCLPDGKMFIGGIFSTYSGVGRTNLARLNIDGTLDTGFNSGSQHTDSSIDLLEMAGDGKLYIAGFFTKVGQTPRARLARVAGSAPQPTLKPAITTQPANRSIALGGSTTFTIAANNATTYAWLFTGEQLPVISAAAVADLTNVFNANTATLTVSNVYAANHGAYRCVVTGPGGSVTSAVANLTVTGIPVPDTQPPTIAITSPKGPVFTTLSETITLNGTAKDNGSVTQVVARIGSEAFAPATGTLTWSATFPLEPGTNQIAVKALDAAGFESALATIAIVRKVSSPLDIVVNGNGVVAPNLDNTLQEIGRSLSLAATPASGWVFSNWLVGSSPVLGGKLTFVMQSNLVVTANFVTNRFLASQGVFNGLALDSTAPTHEHSGFATIKLTSAGGFSGTLIYGGKKVALKGSFDLAGNASVNILAPLPLTVTLALQPAGDVVLGTIGDNGSSIPVRLNRAGFSKTAPATALAGLYTLLVQPNTNNSIIIGDGFGTATVDAAGNVALKGILADAAPVAQKVGLSSSGDWPFFASLYAGKGSIIGWVKIDSNAPNALLPDEGLHWTRPAQAKQPYATGFTNSWLTIGSPYPLPVTGRVLDMTEGITILAGGNLSQNITNDIRLEVDNKITNLSSNALKITVTSAKGSFKGTVTSPAGGKPIAVQGAILPRQNMGGGFFTGTNSTGQVYLGR